MTPMRFWGNVVGTDPVGGYSIKKKGIIAKNGW